VDLGRGLVIDAVTLRTVVGDAEVFAASVRVSTDPADVVLDALMSGRLDEAQRRADRMGASSPDSPFRVRALAADVRTARGDHEGAIAAYRALLAETIRGPREAVARQHLGTALFAAGQLTAARAEFDVALRRRTAAGASADLVATSQMALARVEELLDGS
jgi:predicted Zn-dependent protease